MKSSQIKVGAILTYLSMGLGLIISLIYTPIMIRLLGQSEYGLYNLAASVISYLGILNFGFGSTYIRFYSRYKTKNDNDGIAKLNGMFLIIFSVIGVIALLAGITLSFFSANIFGDELTVGEIETARILLIILSFNLAISFPSIVFISYIRANEQFIFQNIVSLLKTILNPLLILPILLLGYGSIGMALGITLLSVVVEITHMLFALKKLNISFDTKSFDKKLFKEMTVFTSFIFMYMVIDQINWNVDKYLIGRFRGTIEVAVYSIAAQFNTYLISLAIAVSSVLVPRINKLVASDESDIELTKLFIKVGRIQFVIVTLILSGFFIFGYPFIKLWAGENYESSYYVALILMVPMLAPLIQNSGIEIRKAKNKHKTPVYFMFTITLLNILLTIPLTKEYGPIGSAVGTAIAILVNQIFINIYYYKIININIIQFWKNIFSLSKGVILPIALGLSLWLFYDNFSDFLYLSFIPLYVIIYILSVYFLGFNQYEKDLFFNKIYKKLLKRK